MERNWLIRTNQKQILGPVSKAKVVEFLQKGALGLNDEVMCGNGYWFWLKEKDLVDKYLYGDVPQSYNPISECKSVLSRRENPDQTMSLNAVPATKISSLKSGEVPTENLPINSDLEFPDITKVIDIKSITSPPSASVEETKLPSSEDLEFPDISLIKAAIEKGPKVEVHLELMDEMKIHAYEKEKVEVLNNEPVIYPKEDDLDYPEMPNKVEKNGPTMSLEVDVENDSDLTLIVNHQPPKEQNLKSEKIKPNIDEKKLFHERKAKVTINPAENKADVKLPRKNAIRTEVPEHLKKQNDNYLLYILIILILIIFGLFFYYYSSILNKPFPV